MIEPHYSKLPPHALDGLHKLIDVHGYFAVTAGIADILSQDVPRAMPSHAFFTLHLGQACAMAARVDEEMRGTPSASPVTPEHTIKRLQLAIIGVCASFDLDANKYIVAGGELHILDI